MTALILLAGVLRMGRAEPVSAQVPDASQAPAQVLVLVDGSRLVGRVERETADKVWFRTASGVLVELARSQVRSVAETPSGMAPSTGHAGTRLFFAPTGRSLPKGWATLGVYELLLPFVQYGVTDWFSIGGGTPLIFAGGMDRPVWLTPKLQLVSRPGFGVAAGVMHMLWMGQDDGGIAYAVATAGSVGHALTFGVGMPYAKGSRQGVLLAGAEQELTPKVTLISENYATSKVGLVSLGVRFHSGSVSADLGLAMPMSGDGVFVFPLANFVWVVGGRKAA